jgi:hypothetical protein
MIFNKSVCGARWVVHECLMACAGGERVCVQCNPSELAVQYAGVVPRSWSRCGPGAVVMHCCARHHRSLFASTWCSQCMAVRCTLLIKTTVILVTSASLAHIPTRWSWYHRLSSERTCLRVIFLILRVSVMGTTISDFLMFSARIFALSSDFSRWSCECERAWPCD